MVTLLVKPNFKIAIALLFAPIWLTAQSASGAETTTTATALTVPVQRPTTTGYREETSQPILEETHPSGPPIVVEFGMATRLRLLNAVVRNVWVAEPEVADVIMNSFDTLYIIGKHNGRTTLYVDDDKGHVLLNKIIDVTNGPVTVLRGITPAKKDEMVTKTVYNSRSSYDASNSSLTSNSTMTDSTSTQ